MSDLSAHIKVEMGSDRSFGFVFTVVAAILTLWCVQNGWTLAWPSAASTAGFLVVTLVRPELLGAANRYWFRFGNMLHAIISPVVMMLIYLVTFFPIGMAFRAIRRDPLARNIDRAAVSYWVGRETQPGQMKHQF